MNEIKKIYESKDYNQFLFMKGNRPINQKKIKRMTKRIQACIETKKIPFLVIRVTNTGNSTKENKFFISDGQHTYLVLKNLGLPINYYIVKDEGINQVRLLNSDMTNWSIWDYVISYADTGHEQYIKLLELRNKYKHIIQNELFINLALSKFKNIRGGNKEIIKTGNFKFSNYDYVLKLLDKLTDYKIIKGIKYTNYLFLRAVVFLISFEKYDHDRMLKQLRKYPSITRMTDIDGYLEVLLQKYNYNMRNVDKISMYELKGV